MGRFAKLIVAAVVLVGGIALAWQYRRPASDAMSDAAPGKPLAAAHLSATDSAGNSGPIAASSQAPPVASTPQTSPAKNSDHTGVPELPRDFTGAVNGESNPPPLGADSGIAASVSSPRLGSLNGGDSGPTHKVTDGDTLTELAKQYLGSANRWNELYDYNRDVLTNPDLLPIGAELRIPAKPFRPTPSDAGPSGAPANATSPAARPVSQSISGPSSQPSNANMVPVPSGAPGVENPTPPTGGPSAKLRRLPPVLPEPTGHLLRLAPRTYVVQSGDTLNSIAEKLYGDGARGFAAQRKSQSRSGGTRPATGHGAGDPDVGSVAQPGGSGG